MISAKKILVALTIILLTGAVALAGDQTAGRFVQLRGTATIERGKSHIPAQVKGEIFSSDIITTASNSRAKLLFIDDSVLTLSDSSRLVVKEFIHSKGEQGRSVFNLLDGKMRSVVGKTKFEVQTPTAVAAARGTVIYFDVGSRNNQSYSKIICLEGNVQIRNIATTVSGQVTLTPGTMVVVKANEPPPPPAPAPPAELEKARKATQANNSGTTDSSSSSGTTAATDTTASSSISTGSDSTTASSGTGTSSAGSVPATAPVTPQTPTTPPIQQQTPIVQPKKVNITIGIPGQ